MIGNGRVRAVVRGIRIIPRGKQLDRREERRTLFTHNHRNARGAAIQEFFRILESKYGNLPSLLDAGPPGETIVSSSEDGVLRTEDLIRLFRHEATALHVPNFYHRDSASRLGGELIRESNAPPTRVDGDGGGGGMRNWKVSTSRGLESSNVSTLGEHPPYNVAVAARDGGRMMGAGGDDGRMSSSSSSSSSSPTDDYFEGVKREFRSRRIRRRDDDGDDDHDGDPSGGSDHYRLWPLDKLRLELEEAWPAGAGLAREEGGGRTAGDMHGGRRPSRPFGGGLPRIMRGPTRWRRGFVHVDELGPLDPGRGLFSANIYLTMPTPPPPPPEGGSSHLSSRPSDSGALYVWPLGVRNRWDWYRVSFFSFEHTRSASPARSPPLGGGVGVFLPPRLTCKACARLFPFDRLSFLRTR